MIETEQNFLGVARSAIGRRWIASLDREGVNDALTMSQKFGIAEPLARVLAARSIPEEEVLNYLDPTLKALTPDPATFVDMEKATERIVHAIDHKEKVAIFGDYDVDGACSSAILYQFLTFFGLDAEIYIPDRIVEGYGPNPQAMLYSTITRWGKSMRKPMHSLIRIVRTTVRDRDISVRPVLFL